MPSEVLSDGLRSLLLPALPSALLRTLLLRTLIR
jgi:hypothetical protein